MAAKHIDHFGPFALDRHQRRLSADGEAARSAVTCTPGRWLRWPQPTEVVPYCRSTLRSAAACAGELDDDWPRSRNAGCSRPQPTSALTANPRASTRADGGVVTCGQGESRGWAAWPRHRCGELLALAARARGHRRRSERTASTAIGNGLRVLRLPRPVAHSIIGCGRDEPLDLLAAMHIENLGARTRIALIPSHFGARLRLAGRVCCDRETAVYSVGSYAYSTTRTLSCR